MPSPVAAWYPDPAAPSRVRWWDGEAWTHWVREPTGAGTPPPGPTQQPSVDEGPVAKSSELPAAVAEEEAVVPSSADPAPEWAPAAGVGAPEPAPAAAPEVWSSGLSEESLSSAIEQAGWSADSTEAFAPASSTPVWPAAGGEEASAARSEPVWPAAGGEEAAGARSEPVWPAEGAVDRRVVEHAPWPPQRLARSVETAAPVPDPSPPAAAEPAPGPLEIVAPAPTPLITEERPRPVRPMPAPPTHEISIGAALLPPLEPPAPPVDPSAVAEQGSSGRGGVLRGVLIVALVVATSVIGLGLYTRGTFDQLLGRPSRQPSSDGVRVYEGTGYTFEVPSDWEQEQPLGDVDFAFVTPGVDVAQVINEQDEAIAATDLSNPTVRTAAFDTVIRVVQAVNPGAQVLARKPVHVSGAPGEKVTMAGTQPYTGKSFQSTVYLFVHEDALFAVGLVSDESGPDKTVAVYFDRMVESFRFD